MTGEATSMSAEKQTLLALRALRQRVEELEGRARAPIAIVGIACRFPDGVNTPEDYWTLLTQKHDAIREIPRDRMDLDSVFDSRPQTPGKTYSRWAGLLDAPGDFDAEFFGISPREAIMMDPQQRLLLEVSWQALESAAINPKTLAGQNAGVFVGITTSEYAQLLQRVTPPEHLVAYVLQGSALNATAGRLSYFYGVNGPSMAIDTACSSSLVAIDRACRSLREGEIPLAIAAGVNVLATPETLIVASQWGIVSPTGKVRAFDIHADGFVRGEGCGVLILKRLEDAERNGDRILGLILGSAINQDGASSGLTVPNGLAQQALLREAHRRAGIEARQVGYVEAHGTGTSLGDPIEAEALGEVFSGERAEKLLIGSVKTNIGHLESAAGVAGLIKIVLSLQHKSIPPQLHWEQPNEHVHWSELPLEVVTEPREWQPVEGRRIGGVSSFGFSGTNAHVVLESWRDGERAQPEEWPREEILIVTARNEAALRQSVEQYAEFLSATEAGWSDICYTAAVGRAVFGERVAIVATGKNEAADMLRGWLRGDELNSVYRGHVSAGQRGENDSPEIDTSLAVLAAGFVRGAVVDWTTRAKGRDLQRVDLPTYPFQREHYWIETPPFHEVKVESIPHPATGNGMLGQPLCVAGVRALYESQLSEQIWIGEHMVEGRPVLPATGHLELMLEAGVASFGPGCALEDVILQAPLTIEGERRTQTVVEEETGERSRVRLYAERADGGWLRVSEGWLRKEEKRHEPERVDIKAICRRLQSSDAVEEFYARMASRGMVFGERFRGVERAWVGAGEALGEIVERHAPGPGWELAPWWLDACLQIAGMVVSDGTELYLPLSVEKLQVHGKPGGRSWSHIQAQRIDSETFSAEVNIVDPDGSTLVQLSNLRFRRAAKRHARVSMYRVEWVEAQLAADPIAFNGHWVVLAEAGELGAQLRKGIQKRGATCSVLSTVKGSNGIETDAYGVADDPAHSSREFFRNIIEQYGAIEGVLDLRPTKAPELSRVELTEEDSQNLTATEDCLSLLQALLLEQLHVVRAVWMITGTVQSTAEASVSAQGRAIQALRRTVILEFPELDVRSLDIEAETDADGILNAIANADAEEMMMRGGRILVPRLKEKMVTRAAENSELIPATSGLIEELTSVSVERETPGEDEVEIAVQAHGINFRDVMTLLDMLPNSLRRIGGECAGVVTKAGLKSGLNIGDRVFALAVGSFRKFVTVKSTNVARIPEGLTLGQAAGLPVAYLTAFLGLDRLASVRPGESVLIHSAAGGLGLAAVFVAQARGAEVYATAGSEEKRAYLRTLGVRHVLPSRTTEFAEEVMRVTNSRGVDVVLNSLTGQLAEKTLSILSTGGRFLEVGKRDTLSAEAVRRIRPDVRYSIYDLGEEAAKDSVLVPSLLAEMLRSLSSGVIPPLPITEFADPKDAFRYMAQARHIGKLVVTVPDAVSASASLKLNCGATYLITGGCGGLGLIFAERLVDRGACHLLLMGRSDPKPEAMEVIRRMQSRGAEVSVVKVDVSDRAAVESALSAIPVHAPLKGILHAAGVLDDHSLLEQDADSLATVLRPKWRGAWNLHTLTRGEKLDFFVLFSSAAALLGSQGQANYAVANAMLDALADHRRQSGLPALSIQWGPWNAPGMTEKLKVDLRTVGIGSIDPADGADAFETLLDREDAVAAVLGVHSWERFVEQRQRGTSDLFALLSNSNASRVTVAAKKEMRRERFSDALASSEPYERRALMHEHLRQQTVQILSLPSQTRIDENEALHDLGLDSLMAVELRNALVSSLDRQLPPTIVLDYPTLRTLTDFLLAQLFEDERARTTNEINAMTDEEAEQLLLAELGRGEHGR